jgi:hypothetical protein
MHASDRATVQPTTLAFETRRSSGTVYQWFIVDSCATQLAARAGAQAQLDQASLRHCFALWQCCGYVMMPTQRPNSAILCAAHSGKE